MSKVCVDAARLPRLVSPLHPPHLTWVLAGARHAFDLACVVSVGDSACPSVSVSGYVLKTHFHHGCALHCIAWREIQRCGHGQSFYFYHHAMPCNATRSRRNGNKPLSKDSTRQ